MTADEAAHVVKAVATRNRPKRPAEPVREPADDRPPWRRPWSRGDKFAVIFTSTWAVLILLAPVLTDHTASSVLATLAAELHPWPGR